MVLCLKCLPLYKPMIKISSQPSEPRIYGGRKPRVVRPGVDQYDVQGQTLKKGRSRDYGGVEDDAAIDHGTLTGLNDNDHPQYFLKTAGEGDNIVLGTSTGTKIGTGTNQKLAFYNATPITQQANTVSLEAVLSNLGLRASGTAAPLSIGDLTISDGKNIILDSTTGTKIGTATTQKLGFYNATPIARPGTYTPTNVVADRSYDANATTVDELADVLGTLIADLQSLGLIG